MQKTPLPNIAQQFRLGSRKQFTGKVEKVGKAIRRFRRFNTNGNKMNTIGERAGHEWQENIS